MQFIDFLLFRQGKTSAIGIVHVPSDNTVAKRHPGGISGEFHMAADFDEPLEEFAEYM